MMHVEPNSAVIIHPATQWAPDGNAKKPEDRYMSQRKLKPWDFDLEVSMPHFESLNTLPTVIDLLRTQTVRPFISIIDCGSSTETCLELEKMRNDDLEIHYHRFNGVRHVSDFPATACDFAFSSCRSEKLILMHTDVFLRSIDALETMLEMCSKTTPVVGFQMTPREHPAWKASITHTFSVFHMEQMRKLGATWGLPRACDMLNCEHSMTSAMGNMLDTETAISMVLQRAGIKPMFIGTEQNFEMTRHPLIHHVRSLTGSGLYCQTKRIAAEARLAEAMAEAERNLRDWKLILP
jgi:hypothetical protein